MVLEMERLYDEYDEQKFVDEQPSHPVTHPTGTAPTTDQWLSQELSQSLHREGYILDVQEQLKNTADPRKQEQLLRTIESPPL